MSFRPLSPLPRYAPYLVAAGLGLLGLVWMLWFLQGPPGPRSVILGALMTITWLVFAVALYRAWALYRLDYWVERDAIRVLWAGDVVVIPMGEVQHVGPVASPTVVSSPQWWRWPTQWVEHRRGPSPRVSYATRPQSECLAIRTARTTYIVSPQQPDAFIAAVAERRKMGPARELAQTVEVAPIYEHWLLHERWPRIVLGAGLVFGLLFIIYVLWRYPSLPVTMPLHFDAAGDPDRIGPRRALLLLPAVTLLIWLFNALIGMSLYERYRLASYILWASALVLEIISFLTVRNLFVLVG